MLKYRRLQLLLRRPSLLPVAVRRAFPIEAVANDRECAHLVKSWSSGRLPRKAPIEVFPEIAQVSVIQRKPYARILGTAIDLPETALIAAVLQAMPCRKMLEIGTNDGYSTLNWAANIPAGGSVVTVDLPVDKGPVARQAMGPNACDPNVVGRHFRGEPEEAAIRQVFADSQTMDWQSLGGPFDAIFIDGCHERGHVANDTRNALGVLAPQGVLFWHDYGLIPDVSEAVDAAGLEAVAIHGTRLAAWRNRPVG
jgi:predicted O-methyltransferase YrrM